VLRVKPPVGGFDSHTPPPPEKQTLLSILLGLPIHYHGTAVTGPGADHALIFQQPSHYPWLSALDNVAFGLRLPGVGRNERRQRLEVTKIFQEQALAEMLDTRIIELCISQRAIVRLSPRTQPSPRWGAGDR
jgi:ABC-type taurine transport system ATPase subunit